jgi:hypothetical protein
MASAACENETDLPPPGSRWGAGAQSVLPYLTKSLQAKPAAADAREPRHREPEREPNSRPATP